MPARLLKILFSLPFLVAAGLFGAYVLFGFFLVDPVAKKLLPWIGEEKLASRLTVQQVEFNPLTLEATVHGLQLAEKNGEPLAGFEQLYVNLEGVGLFRWAWRMREVQLVGPYGDVVVRKGGRLNWAGLIDKLNEDKEPPSGTMPRVLVDHIRIEKGDIEYTDADRSGEPFRLHLKPLGIELDGLSTLPEDRGDYVIAARMKEHGGTLKWKGDVSLNPLKSDGEVALGGVSLGKLLNIAQVPRNFELPSGQLEAGTRYRFALVKDKTGQDRPWLQLIGANLVIKDLVLSPRGGSTPVLELAEAAVADASLDLMTRKLEVGKLSLKSGKVSATREANGTLDWQTLFAAVGGQNSEPAKTEARPAPAPSTKAEAPWKADVQAILLEGWSAHYTDKRFVRPVTLQADSLAVDAAMKAEFGASPDIVVAPVSVKIGPIRAMTATGKFAELAGIDLSNASFSSAKAQLDIEAIEVAGFKTTVSIDKDKQINWNRLLERHKETPKAYLVEAATSKSEFDFRLGRLALNGIAIALSDESVPNPVKLDVINGRIQLEKLGLDLNRAVPLQAGFTVRQGGSFSANGSVVPGKPGGKVNLKLSRLSLKPFAPYVSQFARLDLESGALATNGKLNFAQDRKGMKLAYNGAFSIDDLAIIEEETSEAFLGWGRLSSDTLQISLGPNRVHMNELVASRPFGKIIIFEDKSINLKRILRTEPDGRDKTAAKPEEASQAGSKARVEPGKTADQPAAQEAADIFPVAIERLRIDNANAEFADLSLPTPFGTRMHSLSGVITGLSTDPATTAQVELDGSVDDYGLARVRGAIKPFRATDFTDLQLTFRNLEMVNLTPYSGKFAGRKIDSGKLSVDLEYKIKDRQLAGENKFVINKLKLGEHVDSPDALKLPLDLAIALLQDSNGVIDVDLPISGSLDDPQFSYGKIIWKAIVNVLTKLVTAPFRALGSLLGISSEKLEAVSFDPGSSVLLPPEQEKLKAISEALAKRPALTLTLEPAFDPAADRRALQVLAMRREAATVAGTKLAPGEAPGPVDVNNYKIQTWLEDRYADLAGKAEYQKLRAGFKGKEVGLMETQVIERLGRQFKSRAEGPASPLHTELLERLTERTKIEDAALVKLAQARGLVMRDALLKLGLEAGRLSVAKPGEQAARDKAVPSKLSLGAGGKPAAAETPPRAEPVPAAH